MFDLIGIGECMVEFTTNEDASSATHWHRSFGGDVLNSLVTASRLGLRTAFVTRVGQDLFGSGLRASWASEGVDTSHAPLVPGTNGVYFISLRENGEREFTYRRSNSAASQLEPNDLDEQMFAHSRAVLLSGVTQAISRSAEATILRAAQLARAFGVTVIFDPNYRPALWAAQGGLSSAQRAWTQLEPFVDVLLPSFPADVPALGWQGTSAEHLLQGVTSPKIIAIKCGDQGVWVHSQASPAVHVPALPNVTVLDTTGAGDAWNGAFIAAYLKGQPLNIAAREANRVAAMKLAHRGAIAPREAFGLVERKGGQS
ncbi:MAG: sugar kinase [Pleurocapsa sp. SU_196_0]|nr:sugar kinase [Pleurocapsa sp. SU_196_0]